MLILKTLEDHIFVANAGQRNVFEHGFIHYTSHTFHGNHQSLQGRWNVGAHVNNFFCNLVKRVDFSDLSGATVGWFISFSE